MSKRFFPRGLKVGDPVSKKGFVEGILKMADALDSLSVHDGRVDWSNGKPKIVVRRRASAPATSYNQVPSVTLTFNPDGGSWSPGTPLTLRVISPIQQTVVSYACAAWHGTGSYWAQVKAWTEGTTPVEFSFTTPGSPYTKWVILARHKVSDTEWSSQIQSKDFLVQ